jgi:hypothetical protein
LRRLTERPAASLLILAITTDKTAQVETRAAECASGLYLLDYVVRVVKAVLTPNRVIALSVF